MVHCDRIDGYCNGPDGQTWSIVTVEVGTVLVLITCMVYCGRIGM